MHLYFFSRKNTTFCKPWPGAIVCSKNAFGAAVFGVFCAARFLTFWFAEHFPKEKVQHQQKERAATKAFDAYILFCKNAFLHQQNVTNAFWQRTNKM